MKKKYICFLAAFFLIYLTCEAQSMNGPAVGPRLNAAYSNLVNINGQDGFYLKKDLYLTNSYTIINGERVLGVPFLYPEWEKGSLITPDNRVYTDYGFKYNVENQTVFFINGKDSLEVNEDIKEFSLTIPKNDTVFETVKFVNANQYQKSNRTFYYEIVMDDERGTLLRINEKKVASLGDGLLASKSQKYLKLERTYFYYDKQKKKVNKIKSTENTISMLKISEEDAKKMQLNQYDLNKEEDIIAFMLLYYTPKKAF